MKRERNRPPREWHDQRGDCQKGQTDQGEAIHSSEVNLGDSVLFVGQREFMTSRNTSRTIPDLNFDYLSNITGADYLNEEREPRFEVVYELHSIEKNHSIRIRVGLDEEDPTIPTVSDLWKGALPRA